MPAPLCFSRRAKSRAAVVRGHARRRRDRQHLKRHMVMEHLEDRRVLSVDSLLLLGFDAAPSMTASPEQLTVLEGFHQVAASVVAAAAGDSWRCGEMAEGESSPLVGFRLEAQDLSGNPLANGRVHLGDEFQLQVYVQDLRPGAEAKGVFAAYFDVGYNDGSLFSLGGTQPDEFDSPAEFNAYWTRSPHYPNGHQLAYPWTYPGAPDGVDGDGVPDEFDEVGAFAKSTPLGSGEFPLVKVRLTAEQLGVVTFAGNPSDWGEMGYVLLFDSLDPVSVELVNYGTEVQVTITRSVSAADDTATVLEDGGVTIDVLANDILEEGSTGTLAIQPEGFIDPSHGIVTILAGKVFYTPDPNYFGVDTFTYTAVDGLGNSDTAVVTVTVLNVNDPPIAVNDTFTGILENRVDNVLDLMANDSPGPGEGALDNIRLVSVGAPDRGGTVMILGNRILYTPAPNFVGIETFSYSIADSADLTASALVTVTVTQDVHPPEATSFTPATNTMDVASDTNLVLTFNEDVWPGTGIIEIRRSNDDVTVQTIDVTSPAVTVAGAVVTINPPVSLPAGTSYYVLINSGAVDDLSGNAWTGIDDTTTWNFTTASLPAWTIDDGDAGYQDTLWSVGGAAGGYLGDYRTRGAGTGSHTATWTVTGLAAGIYQVFTTWVPASNRATNSPYRILDSATELATVRINQRVVPDDVQAEGHAWEQLGTFTVTSGTLVVELSNAADGFVIADAVRLVTWEDVYPPDVENFTPPANTTDVPPNTHLVITFNENVRLGSGSIVINRSTNDETVQTIDVPSSAVTIEGAVVTIDLPADLASNTSYYVLIGSGTVEDLSGNAYAGIGDNSTWNFVTGNLPAWEIDDGDAGYHDTLWGVGGAAGGYLGDYRARGAGTGSHTARWTFTDLALGTYDVFTTWVPASNRATNSPYRILDATTELAIVRINQRMAPDDMQAEDHAWEQLGTFTVTSGKLVVELSNAADGFVIADAVRVVAWEDVYPPMVVSFTPPADATDVALDANLVITFDEDVRKGTGIIQIKRSTDDVTVQTIDVMSPAVTMAGAVMTINPPFSLADSKSYYVLVGSGAVEDLLGNVWAGIDDTTTWNFTTVEGDASLVGFRLEAQDLSGNPLSNGRVQVGDEFQLQVYVQDLRPGAEAKGVFSAYFDVGYNDGSLFSLGGTQPDEFDSPAEFNAFWTRSPHYPNGKHSAFPWTYPAEPNGVDGDGVRSEFDEVGAFGSLNPLGPNELPLVTVRLTAEQPGVVTFVGNPAELRWNDTVLYGLNYVVPIELIDYGVAIQVTITQSVKAVDETATVLEDGSVTIDVLANDVLEEGSTGTLAIQPDGFLGPSHGSVTILAGKVRYTPDPNYFGADAFTYTAIDGLGNSAAAVVTVTVLNVNDPPNAANDSFVGMLEDSANNVLHVMANDSPGPGEGAVDEISLVSVGTPSRGGSVMISGDRILYTPAPNFFGIETFTYAIADSVGLVASALVTVTVTEDVCPPEVVSFTPATDATDVASDTNLVLTFNEHVRLGTGIIEIWRSSDDTKLQTIDATSPAVTAAGAVVTINPPVSLPAGMSYYVLVDSGAVEDLSGNAWVGISDTTVWDFTTTSLPAWINDDGDAGYQDSGWSVGGVAGGYLSDYRVRAAGTGSQTATWTMTDLASGTYDVFTTWVLASNRATNAPYRILDGTTELATERVNQRVPPDDLHADNHAWEQLGTFTVTSGTLVVELSNAADGFVIADAVRVVAWEDVYPPVVVSFTPPADATDVALDADLVITFHEDVRKGTGNILIKRSSDDVTLRTIDVTSPAVTVAGAVVTINPPTDLPASTSYYVLIGSGTLEDLSGNAWVGISDTTVWDFTTTSLPAWINDDGDAGYQDSGWSVGGVAGGYLSDYRVRGRDGIANRHLDVDGSGLGDVRRIHDVGAGEQPGHKRPLSNSRRDDGACHRTGQPACAARRSARGQPCLEAVGHVRCHQRHFGGGVEQCGRRFRDRRRGPGGGVGGRVSASGGELHAAGRCHGRGVGRGSGHHVPRGCAQGDGQYSDQAFERRCDVAYYRRDQSGGNGGRGGGDHQSTVLPAGRNVLLCALR